MLAPTGCPSAASTSRLVPVSAAALAPGRSRSGGATRCAIGPDLATRPPPRSHPSPASTSRLMATSTSDKRAGDGHLGRQPEIGEDLRSEGAVAEHLECAVLGKQHKGHEQAAAEDGAPGLARA